LGPLSLKGVTATVNPNRTPLDLTFAAGKPIWLEVGFGGGEHLVHMAALNPQAHLIGAEPFVNGIAMLLGKIRAAGVTNLALHPGDVRDLFDVLPDGCLQRVFLNYPDPWPKARHHRRRFVTPEYLQALARVTASGAEFRVATDIPNYVRQTLEEVPQAGFALERQAGQGGAWEDWLSTRYEQKALREGRAPHYLTFRRV
ncbi:MAG: tRNA (guanine(46)-N(7))-methyltransferase TrmB, partial [Paracoccaceae bacterium]